MRQNTRNKKQIPTTHIDFEHRGEAYLCVCTPSKRRSYAVSVHPDGTIRVLYPRRTPRFVLRGFITSKRNWIENKLEEVIRAGIVKPLRGKDGDALFVAGKQKRVEIREHTTKYIEEDDEVVRVFTKNINCDYVLKSLLAWYKAQAEVLFQERLEIIVERFDISDVPSLRIKNLKGRWGSMSPCGEMTLSLALVAAPVEALDQVIAHELVHLKHRHHKKSFYDELGTRYPQWREHNALLSPKYMLK